MTGYGRPIHMHVESTTQPDPEGTPDCWAVTYRVDVGDHRLRTSRVQATQADAAIVAVASNISHLWNDRPVRATRTKVYGQEPPPP